MWEISSMSTPIQVLTANMKCVAWEFKQLNKRCYYPLTAVTVFDTRESKASFVKKTWNTCGYYSQFV